MLSYIFTLSWWKRRRLREGYRRLLYSLKIVVTQINERVDFTLDIREASLV